MFGLGAAALMAAIDWETVGLWAVLIVVGGSMLIIGGSLVFTLAFGVYASLRDEGLSSVAASAVFAAGVLAVAGVVYVAVAVIPWSSDSSGPSGAGGGNGGGGGGTSIEDVYGDDVVAEYCAVGSVSQAQYRGCKENVTFDDVVAADTPASRKALSGIPEEAYTDLEGY